MATLEQIRAKVKEVRTQAEALAARQSSGAIEKIRELMAKHNLTTADIEAHVGHKKGGGKPGMKSAGKPTLSAAKYREPKTGATWTGHGRAPAWIANAKDRTRFLINGDSAGSASTAVKPAKAGNYVRGVQPAKFRDPKTGTEWSGRGRAPAWLAGAKDRSRFLIAGVGAGAVKPKAAAVRKAPAKKAVSRKVVGK
jgi:DNA-binding protein H-NS